ncbi:hypothetical protein V6N13_033922 [Hibiscus sabdariffa]
MLPSSVQAPNLELKDLPNHLKYVYLGEDGTFPVIIAKGLTNDQKEKLVQILKEYKAAVGWTLADIKGISPSICMHRILLEDDAKPSRESQRRLNPTMSEVVMKVLRSQNSNKMLANNVSTDEYTQVKYQAIKTDRAYHGIFADHMQML